VVVSLVNYLNEEFAKKKNNDEKKKQHKSTTATTTTTTAMPDLRSDPLACKRLFELAEDCCIGLSTSPQFPVSLPFITMDFATMQPLHLEVTVSRAVLASACGPALAAIAKPAVAALEALWGEEESSRPGGSRSGGGGDGNRQQQEELETTVLLVGGGARSPIIRAALESAFRDAFQARQQKTATPAKAPAQSPSLPLFCFVVPAEPEEANAIGAALAAKYGWGNLVDIS
jgi:molecular chaperone DnaK (HSP70)